MAKSQSLRRLELFIAEWKCEEQGEYYVKTFIDGEQVHRTPSVRGKCVYFQELGKFKIKDDIGQVSFYVHQQARGREHCIAKTSLSKVDILDTQGLDQWLKMKTASELDDAAGRIRINLTIDEITSDTSKYFAARVTLIEGFGFKPAKMYAKLSVDCVPSQFLTHTWPRPLQDASLIQRSKVCSDHAQPLWCDNFRFDVPTLLKVEGNTFVWSHSRPAVLRISLWNATEGSDDVFLGEACLPLDSRHLSVRRRSFDIRTLTTGADDTEWLQLQRHDIDDTVERKDLGSLRVRLNLKELCIMPLAKYAPLSSFLTETLDEDPAFWVFNAVFDSVTEKDHLARPLVSFHRHNGSFLKYLGALTRQEIEENTDPATLFRANTLATKSIDNFMKLVAYEYLSDSLMPVLSEVLRDAKRCEINPSLLREAEDLNENLARLTKYMDALLRNITSSALLCPPDLRRVLSQLVSQVKTKWPENHNAHLNAVSGFVFLRFFAPAVLNPTLFHLTNSRLTSADLTRTLTLMSKALQTLTNIGRDAGSKEPYMKALIEPLERQFNTQIVNFLIAVATVPDASVHGDVSPAHEAPDPSTVVLKQGYLHKRGQGRPKPFVGNLVITGRKNVKKRYFLLTTEALSYHKSKDDPPIYRIRVEDILGAEPVDPDVLPLDNPFQVIQANAAPLYIGASTPVLASEWLHELRQLAAANDNRRVGYHPGIKASSGWTCCGQRSDTAPGCRQCTKASTAPATPIFRELTSHSEALEAVYQFFIQHQDLMKKPLDDAAAPTRLRSNAQALDGVVSFMSKTHEELDPPPLRPGSSKYCPLTPDRLREARNSRRSPTPGSVVRRMAADTLRKQGEEVPPSLAKRHNATSPSTERSNASTFRPIEAADETASTPTTDDAPTPRPDESEMPPPAVPPRTALPPSPHVPRRDPPPVPTEDAGSNPFDLPSDQHTRQVVYSPPLNKRPAPPPPVGQAGSGLEPDFDKNQVTLTSKLADMSMQETDGANQGSISPAVATRTDNDDSNA